MDNNFLSDEQICTIQDISVTIESYLGHFNEIDYFQVSLAGEFNENDKGLLRVGSVHGGLAKELKLREILGKQKFLAPLLAFEIQAKPKIQNSSDEIVPQISESKQWEKDNNLVDKTEFSELNHTQSLDNEELEIEQTLTSVNVENNYLEEESYPEKVIGLEDQAEILLLLTHLPEPKINLENWLSTEKSLESSLLIASQVCQFFRLICQHEWCVFSVLPQFIEINTPLIFFDLTGIHPINEFLGYGLTGNCYPPELSFGDKLQETTSSYVVGSLLLKALFPTIALELGNINFFETNNLVLPTEPKIHQILKIALSFEPSERFSLTQLLELLIETRKYLKSPKIQWQIAHKSTVGLSISRLHNEDSYGIREYITNQQNTKILAVIADGMGGLSQGEIASNLAVTTVINTPLPETINSAPNRQLWLIKLIDKANEIVTNNVNNGGTTLSVLMAFNQELQIAHVGDSRILLLRKGIICQLTEDHSMVAMLLSSGQINYEESLKHCDRNVLTKSLGSKPTLTPSYVQTLSNFGDNFTINLEDQDLLLLCSDGVWDFISNDVIVDTFIAYSDLNLAVNYLIDEVLKQGANDNATLIALKISLETPIL